MSDPLVTIILPGDPVPKARPRFRIVRPRNGAQFVTVYSDSQTVAYENALKRAGIEAMMGAPAVSGPLSLVLTAYMPIPASWSTKKQAAAVAGDIMPVSGIDLDNVIKQVDGLNYHPPRFRGDREKRPIIWLNDSQIVSIQALKLYSDDPRLEISVYEFDDVGPSEPELI